MKTKNFKFKSMALVLFALVLSSNVWGVDVTIASWGTVSLPANTAVNASSYQGKTAPKMTSNKAMTTSGTNAYYGSSAGGATITISGLPSGYKTKSVTFYSRASKGGNFAVSYSTNGGTSYTNAGTSSTLGTSGTPKAYTVTFSSAVSDVTNIKFVHSGTTGSLYFGTVSVTGEAAASDTWSLAGGMNGWSTTANPLTGTTTLSTTCDLTANTDTEFKIVKNGSTYYGNNGTMSRSNCSGWEFTSSAGNAKITADKTGTYTFNVTINGSGNPVLSVTYPADTWQLAGFDNWGNKIDFVNGSCQVNLTAKTYTAATDAGFKLIKNGSDYYGCNGTMTRSSCTNWTFYTGNDNKNCGITADVAGTYTFTINTSSTNPQLSVTYPTKYTVTYNGNGNTSGSAPAAVDYANGATVTVAGNTGSLAKTGYDFGGWNTKADGTGTNYTAGSGTFTISANTTLYAKWTIKSYTVTKGTITGGSATVPSSVNHGADVTLTGLTPDANHKLPYTITVTGNYGSIEGATIKNVTGAITVNVAFTEKETYTVTFYNAGEVVKTISNVAEGTLFSAIKPTIGTGSGQLNIESCDNNSTHFMGWTTEESFQKRDNAPSYVADGTAINGNMTVRAVWAAEE